MAEHRRRRWSVRLLLAVAVAWLAMGTWQAFKPLPAGLRQAPPARVAHDLALLVDSTWTDASGERRSQQQVFAEVHRLVAQARRAVVADMFLFNAFGGDALPGLQPLSSQLATSLAERMRQVPGLQAVLITDPINTVYGGLHSAPLEQLQQAGVQVLVTDLAMLRAPNPAWSGLWHLCCRWLGNDADGGWLPNPFGEGRVTLRSYLALANLNANHRKTLVVDSGQDWVGLVSSANPHDGSSLHGNIALRFRGDAALDLLHSERAVVQFSGGNWPAALWAPLTRAQAPASAPLQLPRAPGGAHLASTASEHRGVRGADGGEVSSAAAPTVQVLTESRIRDAVLQMLDDAAAGDRIDLAVFYLSHRGVVRALLDAHARGARLRVLLDPNEDAFGRKKNGIPNRQVALELHRAGVPVRWCDTRGEQCHAKLLLLRTAEGEARLLAGSANFTRRNLDDYNLETSVLVRARTTDPVVESTVHWFEQSWHNRHGRQLSVPYAAYADTSRLRYWRYRFMEATGLSSF